MKWNSNRVFNSKSAQNDQIIVDITSWSITTTYVWEAPFWADVADKVRSIRKIVVDETDPNEVITTIWCPLIDGVYESNGNCIWDDGGSNVYNNYTYSK